MELPSRPRRGGSTRSTTQNLKPSVAAHRAGTSTARTRRHRDRESTLDRDDHREDLTVVGSAMGAETGQKQSEASREAARDAQAAQDAEDEAFRRRLEELRLQGHLQDEHPEGAEGQSSLWRDVNGGAPAPPVPLPPPPTHHRPLSGAALATRSSLDASLGALGGPPAGPPRTAHQLEDALRGWLQVNRRLHESREVSLVRGLMSGADVDKNNSGVPRTMASPEAVRAANAKFKAGAVKDREAQKAFEQGLRGGADLHSSGPPSASDYASRVLDGPEEESEEDLTHLSEAQRYALRRRRAIERAADMRGDGPPLDLLDNIGLPRTLHADSNPSLRAAPSTAWGPAPVKQSYGAELASARYLDRKAHQADKGGIRQLQLTPEELMSSWELMSRGGHEVLGAQLSEKEAERLVRAHHDGSRFLGGLRSRGALQVESLVRAVLSETHAAAKVRTHDGIPLTAEDLSHCRVRYRPSRTPVLAPTEFDAEAAISKSKEAPEFELKLEHCHGYSGHSNAAPNLFLTASGSLVYYAAGLGIVSSVPPPKAQQQDTEALELRDDLEAIRAAAISNARSLLGADGMPPPTGGSGELHYHSAQQPQGTRTTLGRGETSLWEGSDVSREEVAETIMDEIMDDMSEAGSRRSESLSEAPASISVSEDPAARDSRAPSVASPRPPLHRAASPQLPRDRSSGMGALSPPSARGSSPGGGASIGSPVRSRATARSLESSRRSGRPLKLPEAPPKSCPHTKSFEEAPPSAQRFFTGHSDDVTCLAIHPNGTTVASGEVGKEPAVCVWGTEGGCKEKSRITHEDGSRGIAAAGFSGGKGKLLATAALDNQHTVRVFEWATGRKIAQGIGQNGTPPQVYGITWDWYTGEGKDEGEDRFVTWGVKHLKLWEVVQERHTAYAGKLCSFGQAPPQDVVCAVFLPPGLDASVEQLSRRAVKGNVPPAAGGRGGSIGFNPNEGMIVTGHPNGEVYLWRNRAVVQIIQAYEPISRTVPKDGGVPTGGSGVRCIRLWQQGFPKHPCRAATGRSYRSQTPEELSHNDGAWVLLLGGDDGAVRMWDLGFIAEDGSAGSEPPAMLLPVYIPKAAGDSQAQAVRTIDLTEDGKVLYVGTYENDVWAFDLDLPATLADPSTATTGSLGATWYQANAACDASRATFADDSLNDRRLVAGSSRSVHAVAFHPKVPEVYAVGCDAPEVLLYHSGWRIPVGEPLFTSGGAQSIAFRNPNGQHIAVGLVDGGLEVFDRNRRRVAHHPQAREPVFDVKYSPNGDVLAAADGEQMIHLYNANKRYQRYAKCQGHSSSIVQVDFSMDGTVLQSVCNAYEVMYWDVAEGRQLAQSQRDQQWATWTAKLGFSVMGIWPEEADGSDINAVHAHQGKGLLVVTDDSGNVRLYNYPCVANLAGCSIYRGHCSHVEMARFSCDGEVVVSVGGADCAALQWRVCSPNGPGAAGEAVLSGKAALEASVAALGPSARNGSRLGGMAATQMDPAIGPLQAAGRNAVQGASSSIARQMLSRGSESSSGYVKRRMAEMQEALNAELAKLDAKYAQKRGRPPMHVAPPSNKVWGAKDASGRSMGWIDAPAAASQSPTGINVSSMSLPEAGRREQTPETPLAIDEPLLPEGEEEEAVGVDKGQDGVRSGAEAASSDNGL